jgi:hypothetical protein
MESARKLGRIVPRKAFDGWNGLDTRAFLDNNDPKTLRVATNVDLLSDGSLAGRDGLRLVATIDPESVGLYSVGGSLRAVITAGQSKPASAQGTVPIIYDAVGDGTIYGSTTISRVSAVSSWDADSAVGIYPVVIIQRTSGTYELHWIKDTPVPAANGAPPPPFIPSTDPVNTKVLLPFKPGETLLKIQEKICVIDNTNGAVWFCSTVNGITDFTTPADAGFLPVIRHATGDRTIQGLSFYDDLMAVCFSDSIQLWQMHPDPAQMQLSRVLNGPGIQYPGSLANVRGDLYYFSRGTFSALKRSSLNGQLQHGDIGDKVAPNTAALANVRPIGLWSQARSAYYCFFGNEAWRYLTSPDAKKTGWTKYVLPTGIVVTSAVEHLGQLYVRSGANVYRFEANYVDGSTYTVETHFLDFNAPSEVKFITTMDFSGTGTPAVYFLPDMREPTVSEKLCTLDGTTSSMFDIAILENSEAPAFRFTGAVGSSTGLVARNFLLDRILFSYTVGQKGL